jgi:hypothetical protein
MLEGDEMSHLLGGMIGSSLPFVMHASAPHVCSVALVRKPASSGQSRETVGRGV